MTLSSCHSRLSLESVPTRVTKGHGRIALVAEEQATGQVKAIRSLEHEGRVVMMKRLSLLLAATMLLSASPAFALFENGGFETGNFAGWSFDYGWPEKTRSARQHH